MAEGVAGIKRSWQYVGDVMHRVHEIGGCGADRVQ